jgi:hypothetical protein
MSPAPTSVATVFSNGGGGGGGPGAGLGEAGFPPQPDMTPIRTMATDKNLMRAEPRF